MDRLIAGYRRFRKESWPNERARYEALATRGQSPHTLIISCSDSRVDPQTVFGAAPGELFVVRNVAGLVPPYQPDARLHGTSAAIEYAVRVLKVRAVVVLGHGNCGGVRAMIDGVPPEAGDFVENWMKIAEPALERVREHHAHDHDHHHGPEDHIAEVEAEVTKLTLENLATFPWIASEAKAGRLGLHAFRFEVFSGSLSMLEKDRFVPVE
jgi:carbonic anhydrase